VSLAVTPLRGDKVSFKCQRSLALSYVFIRSQGIRNGLRHICGMQNECTWKTCGVIDW
jgi:hypothetical protein